MAPDSDGTEKTLFGNPLHKLFSFEEIHISIHFLFGLVWFRH